jgi:hypothetical protein
MQSDAAGKKAAPEGAKSAKRSTKRDLREAEPFTKQSFSTPDRGSTESLGAQQLNLALEKRTVFSGHGFWKKSDGVITVPEGTTLTVYVMTGETMDDHFGQAIELNVDLTKVFKYTFRPGMTVPNLTLTPPNGLKLMGNPKTVDSPTLLKDLLKPNMGDTHWAACFTVK